MVEIAGGIVLAVVALIAIVMLWRVFLVVAAIAAIAFAVLVAMPSEKPPPPKGDPWAEFRLK